MQACCVPSCVSLAITTENVANISWGINCEVWTASPQRLCCNGPYTAGQFVFLGKGTRLQLICPITLEPSDLLYLCLSQTWSVIFYSQHIYKFFSLISQALVLLLHLHIYFDKFWIFFSNQFEILYMILHIYFVQNHVVFFLIIKNCFNPLIF